VETLRKNFGLKLAAVVLAVVGWAYFRFAQNPLLGARFDQQLSVPIVSVNLPAGYVANYTDKSAVVTVSTKRGEPTVKPEEIKAVLDLTAKTTPGIYNVPIQLVAPSVAVQSLSPASVTLTIERIEERSFPLALEYSGTSSVVVGGSIIAPKSAVVRGPSTDLGLVATLRVVAPLPSEPGPFDEMLRPEPVDALGHEIAGVTVSPDLVRVRIQFSAGTGAKNH